MKVNFEVSARHLHLSAKDCLVLFGKSELTCRNMLSQPGEYAAEEVVEIVGPKKSIHKIRVLGPLRERTQVELARSDAIYIGVDAPLSFSGSGVGCDVKLVGPKGSLIVPVAMVAKRHFHLSTRTAAKLKLTEKKTVQLRVYGERSLIFDNIMVRISDSFKDTIHLDTDEGNAAGANVQGSGELII